MGGAIEVPSIERAVSIKDVAERLGVSTKTIRRMIEAEDNPLPAFKVGGQYRLLWSEVESHFRTKKD